MQKTLLFCFIMILLPMRLEAQSESMAAEMPYDNAAQMSDSPLKRHHNVYICDNKLMNEQEYRSLLKLQCPDAFKEYNTGRTYVITGWTLLAVCVPATAAASFGYVTHIAWGVPPYMRETESYKRNQIQCFTSFAFIPISFAGVIASIPLLTIGYKKKHHSVDTFNSRCVSTSVGVNMLLSDDGMGLAITF